MLQPHDPSEILHDDCHRQHPSIGFVYPTDDLDEEDSLKLLRALQRVCDWICRDGRSKPSGIMIRAAVLCWTVRPTKFQFASQTELAAMLGLKDKQSIGREVSSFGKEFGYLDQRHNKRSPETT